MKSTGNIADWNRIQRVESGAGSRSGRYLSAENALIFAGPPRVADLGLLGGGAPATAGGTGNSALYPIGSCEQFSVQQTHNAQKSFEIGSRRSFQAPGRVNVVGSIGRIMFHGPSLLRVMMAYYPNSIAMANGKVLDNANPDSVSKSKVASAEMAKMYPPVFFEAGAFSPASDDSGVQGNYSLFINLMSELFSMPFGLGVLLRDNRNVNYGAFYCEESMVLTHSLGIGASSNVITEAVSFQCDALIPMEFKTPVAALATDVGAL